MNNSHLRTKNGFTTILLVFACAVFILAPLGLFTFELARVNLAREQLRAATDAAALAAAAALASSGSEEQRMSDRAKSIGLAVFKRNTIAGHSLEPSILVNDADRENPNAGQVKISFHVLRSDGTAAQGGSLRVQARAVIGYLPAFGGFINVTSYPVRASSIAGLPKLDVIVLLDISASMTKNTRSILVQRKSVGRGATPNAAGIRNEYVELASTEQPPDGLDEIAGLGIAYQPQRLESNDYYTFDPNTRSLQGNTATPPGNLTPTSNGEWNSTPVASRNYTDVVVDLRNVSADLFPNLATLVEASRGNLDNMQNFIGSNAANSGVNPQLVGLATKAKYQMLAKANLQPFLSANNLVRDFVQELHASNDVHFSLIPFATLAAQPATDANAITSVKDYAVSKDYRPRDVGNVSSEPGILASPLTQVPLDRNDDHYDEVMEQISLVTPQFGTNTADALFQAKRIIDDGTQLRQNARPVVLLVTDGLPVSLRNASGSGRFADLIPLNNIPESRIHPGRQMVTDTFQLATQFGDTGVPIYTVGFLHNFDARRRELGRQVLSTISTNSNNESGFFLAENIEGLRAALKNVQRHLITLQN